MALRIARCDARGVRPTPQGGIEVEAALTRPGVFPYYTPTGERIREWRPPEEVFRPDALATLAHAPVTNRHRGMIGPDTFRKYAAGHVAGEPRIEDGLVVATLWIQDGETLQAIQNGNQEVSCGVLWDVENVSGRTPDGEEYDCILRNPRYNHVAIEPKARLGSQVRLRLDGAGDEISTPEDQDMRTIRFDGKDYPVNTPEEVAALQAVIARAESATQARHDAAQAEVTALRTELSQAQARMDAAQTPEALDRRVRERTELIALARRASANPELRCDGVSDAELRRQVVAAVYPTIRLDGKDATYVDTLFDGARATIQANKVREDAAGARSPETPPAPRVPRQDEDQDPTLREDGSVDLAEAKRLSDQRYSNRYKSPRWGATKTSAK